MLNKIRVTIEPLFQYKQNQQLDRFPILQKTGGIVHTPERHTRPQPSGVPTKFAKLEKSMVR